MYEDTKELAHAALIGVLVTVGFLIVLTAGLYAAHLGYENTGNAPTIVKTIHNVSYHGMTCTETIDSTGNSYMNGCSK